jgi:hypothetical protein
MPTTLLPNRPSNQPVSESNAMLDAHFVDAAEFRRLMVSTRRMERADKLAPKMRGLRDLETGELFLVDERRLLEGKR